MYMTSNTSRMGIGSIIVGLALLAFVPATNALGAGAGAGANCFSSPSPVTNQNDYFPEDWYMGDASASLQDLGATLSASGSATGVPALADAGAWPTKLNAHVYVNSHDYAVNSIMYGSVVTAEGKGSASSTLHPSPLTAKVIATYTCSNDVEQTLLCLLSTSKTDGSQVGGLAPVISQDASCTDTTSITA